MLKEIVCGRCAYYKPDKAEDLACGGYLLLERLAGATGFSVDNCYPIVPSGLALPLSILLCTACPYYRRDCDFAEGVDGAPPCGGFIVTASLLAQGAISLDDMESLL